MKGSRPSQAPLTADNDLSKTTETLAVIDAMVDGLNDHDIDRMDRFFSKSFRWIGNAGCGHKVGLNEFQENWQRPFQNAFSDKVCVDEARVTQGMVLCFWSPRGGAFRQLYGYPSNSEKN